LFSRTTHIFSKLSAKSVAFVGRTASAAVSRTHSAGCACPSCVSFHTAGCQCGACSTHSASCACSACRSGTALFADVAEEASAEVEVEAEATTEEVPAEVEATTEEVPVEVEAMDGVESEDEAHNVERPARASLKKKSKGKDLSAFEIGSMVKGSVRSIQTYGAFIDIGASTDGLLHISQLSNEFVGDVNEVLKEAQEVEVRIVSIDSDKGQVALSLLTKDEADASAARQKRDRPPRQSNRRDDTAVLAGLKDKGWDASAFVEGTVVSTVDFGCFVRIDSSVLNSECEGELDGLVHISALSAGRVGNVNDVVSADQKVQVRVKGINGNKVSLTMLSVEDEESKSDQYGSGPAEPQGAKDWKESIEKFDAKSPVFTNKGLVVDLRK
jgi:predicted RNA-binding protein with RPS1 domain